MNDTTGQRELKAAYAEHIRRFPWDFYVTTTFRRLRRDPSNAAHAVWHSLDKLEATRAFVAVEKHYLDGVHIHALSRHALRPDMNPEWEWKYLFKAHGRSRVEEIRDVGQVSAYCSKYVTKGDYDYYYFGDPEAWLLDGYEGP